MKRTNPERRAKAFARNFGERGEAVRAMQCLVAGCRNFTQAAHSKARKMGGCGGDRRCLVPLCHTHHAEASEARTSARAAFQLRYRIDLEEAADRIALELDSRGLP